MQTTERQRTPAYGLGLAILILGFAGCGHFKYDPYGTGTGELPAPRQPAEPKDVIAAVVVARGPTVIGYFPPVKEAQLDGDPALSAALDDFTAALESARACLTPHGIAVRAAFAESLVADAGGQQIPLPLGEHTPRVGFYLLRADTPPQRVDLPANAGSLREVLEQAASAYFQVPGCPAPKDQP